MAISQGLKNSLNEIRQISSTIYHQYIPVIDDDTDISKLAAPVLQYPEVYNEFCSALLQRIVYTQVDSMNEFQNPLRGLEGNVMPLGYAGQEIYINPAKGRRYNPDDFAGILQKYEADVKVQYLIKNMDLQYPVTVIRTKLKEAFVSWDALDSFITGLSRSLYNGMYVDEYRYTKALVSSAYMNDNIIVKTITNPTSAEAAAKQFIQDSRFLFLDFQSPSSKYNAWSKVGGSGRPIVTWTNPEDIVIILRNDIRAYVDVNVLANAYQIGKADFLANNIYTVDNFDVYDDDGTKIYDGSKIFAMIADRNWFKIKPIDQFMEDQRNANNRSYQLYLNNIKMYEYSLFANAVIFASEEATVKPTSISAPATASVAEGGTVKYTVTTTPFNANTTLTVASSAAGKATAAINGKEVTVTGVDEGSANITVTGTNAAGESVTAVTAVTVTAAVVEG